MIYRAYDIRGTVGADLTVDTAELIGRAFGSEMALRGQSEVLVGRDNRLASDALAQRLMLGVRSTGLNTVDLGELPTPIVYHASMLRNEVPAVMVTGSHLPPDQNGFKLTCGRTPFFGEDIQRLRERIDLGIYTSGSGNHFLDLHAASMYLTDVVGRFPQPEKPLKIVVDAGNGMAGQIAPNLLRHLGHEVIELYCESDGSYPNHPADPADPENLREAQNLVRHFRADLGLVFDGDADRVGFIDHLGLAHATDRALIPLVWEILKHYPGATIITDPLVSQVLIEMIRTMGGVPLLWKSGHSYIKQKMLEIGAVFALETSGHVFIADGYYGYDDGIYTALRLVDILARKKTASFAEIMAAVPVLHTTPQYRPRCPDDQKQQVIEAVQAHFDGHEIITVDGVRVNLPHGWFIIRASNTEPRLSLRFEADQDAALDEMMGTVAGILADFRVEL